MNNKFEIALKVFAVALLGAAVYFYTSGESDRTFACAVLSACSYFLSVRFRFKSKMVPVAEEEGPDEATAVDK